MKVRKEITLAVIIGLILALVIAGGVYRAQTALKNIKPSKLSISNPQSSLPSDEKSNNLFLEIETPDNSVVSENKIQVIGKTLAGTFIAITSDKNDYLIVPNDLGSFSQELPLVKGANSINVTVYTKSGEKVEKKISVVYTTTAL